MKADIKLEDLRNTACAKNTFMQNETWRPVNGFESTYAISDKGRIKRLPGLVPAGQGRFRRAKETISLGRNAKGYRNFLITVLPYRKNHLIHRLVAEAFIPNPNSYPCINHKDGKRANNNVENLEWCTYSMNNQHAHDTGLNRTRKGFKAPEEHHAMFAKPVDYYDKHKKFIKRFNSAGAAARELKIRQSAVSQAALKDVKNPRKYMFKYVE